MQQLNGWIGLLAGTAFVLVLAMQARTLWAARRATGRCVDPSLLPPQAQPAADGHLLLYFHAAGCIMCPPVTRIIEQLRQGRPWILPLDAHRNLELARACSVRGTPALVLLRHGCIERVLVGQKSRPVIEALIDGVCD